MSSLRERKKAQTRVALVEAAWRRFGQQGFDATTIEEIVDDAEVSRSTFFRYFPNKEAVVFPFQHERLERFVERLRTAESESSPFSVVWDACLELASELDEHREQAMAQYALIHSSPNLLAADREFDHEWETAIAEYLVTRGVAELDARLYGATIFGVVRVTLAAWCDRQGAVGLRELGSQSRALLEEGLAL